MITCLRPPAGDPLTTADYRDIFEEMRSSRSLRALVAAMGASEGRIAYWSRYGRDLSMVPDHQARNELRSLVDQPDQPEEAGELLRNAVHPDAGVWLAGSPDGPVRRVLLVSTPEAVAGAEADLNINWPAGGEPVISIRRAPARRTQRAPRKTVNLAPATHARLIGQARAAGVTVETFIQRLLQHYEEQPYDLD